MVGRLSAVDHADKRGSDYSELCIYTNASFFRAAQNIFFPTDLKWDLKSCLVAEMAFL